VSTFAPPHTFATETVSPTHHAWTRYEIEAVGTDRSRLTWRQVTELPVYLRFRQRFGRGLRRGSRQVTERYLACKHHLEAEPPVPSAR